MRLTQTCYRAHDPRWAFSPLSGEGAAIRGARFNPKDVPALYLALSIDGAVMEAAQGFGHRLQPLTICAYDVDCGAIADLGDESGRATHGVTLEEMSAAWASDLSEGKRPGSWGVYDRLHGTMNGIIVPSFANGARAEFRNLVLWRWNTGETNAVAVIDPTGRLPKNQRSWE